MTPHQVQQLILGDQFPGIVQQEQEHAKCLRLDRQHLSALDETEFPFVDFHVSEAEYKRLISHHDFIIRPKRFSIRIEKLIKQPIKTKQSHAPRVSSAKPAEELSVCQPSSERVSGRIL